MENPEIIFNLWFVYDDLGAIYSLRGRAYVGTGDEEEKRSLLKRFAEIDYLITEPFPVPERFHTNMMGPDGERKMAVALGSAVELLGGTEVRGRGLRSIPAGWR